MNEKDIKTYYIGRTIRVFISYTNLNKKLAGELKQELERLGLEVFLAHEDINPSADWQKVILDNLKSTDIFMPIITKDFHESDWTDQESGIAFGDGKFIFPIAVDGNMPYGFLGRFQAFKIKSEEPIFAHKIIESILQGNAALSSSLLDSFIKAFVNSNNWEDAGIKSRLLSKFDKMTDAQVNEIFKGIAGNSQIYGSFAAIPHIRLLFQKYRHAIHEDLVQELMNIDGLLKENHVAGITLKNVSLETSNLPPF